MGGMRANRCNKEYNADVHIYKSDAMELTRAYKFRIYPDATRQAEIDERLILAQQFYNKMLGKSIASYRNGKAKVSMAQFNRFVKEILKDDKKFLKLYSQTRCEIEFRLLKAYQNFFRRIREGNRKPGFPRFRSRDRYKSITYPQDNGSFRIEKGRLRVSKIGTMRIEQHRNIVGNVKTMTIKREGKEYYAIFTSEQIITPPKINDTNPVGIDLGLNNFIALSDGQTIQKPKFLKKREKRIARWQRIIARRNKGSGRREKAKFRLQEEWKGITNQSNDFMHKISDKMVHGGYTSFAVEALHIGNMVKNHSLAQSIQYASWNRFIQMLSYKAESAGMKVIKADPRDTSKTCSDCGNIQDMPLSERTYICNRCGMQKDRDINASINILNRATFGQRGSHAQGENRQYILIKNANGLEELRTDKIHPLRDAVIV